MANAAGSGGKSAARLKRRNESKMIMRQPIMLISILTVIVLLLLFVIYPLVKILLFSLTDASGTFSLATAAEIFSTSRYLKTFGRTMVLGVIVAVIATFIGYIFAYTITRTNVQDRHNHSGRTGQCHHFDYIQNILHLSLPPSLYPSVPS